MTAGSDVIQVNDIGTDPTGTTGEANGGDGVLVTANSNNNQILSNVISGNTGNAIELNGTMLGGGNTSTSGNIIQGNFLGTNAAGTLNVQNLGDGVYVQNAPGTHVGGTTAAQRNIISGNKNGMELFNNSDNSVFAGNYIGTDVTGTLALGNVRTGAVTGSGIIVRGISNSMIGGTVAGSGNLISGNGYDGIDSFAGGNNILMQGNFVGTDVTGTKALGNANDGIFMWSETNVLIGGNSAAARNIISANHGFGITTFAVRRG